jgi:hypothetical protein
MRRHHELDDDDDDVVRDGEAVRVPMYLMDGVQRAVAGLAAPPGPRVRVTDALGASAGFKPGHCFAADSANDPRPAAFSEREKYLTDAWRLAATGLSRAMDPDAAHEVEERLERERGERDAAYDGMVARLCDAWRDAGAASVERDVEADRYLRVITSPHTTPQQKASAQEDLRTYLIANFGERDGARRYAELTAGMRDAVADPIMAALADRQRQLEDAWRMR